MIEMSACFAIGFLLAFGLQQLRLNQAYKDLDAEFSTSRNLHARLSDWEKSK